jgi:hypothetical protein
MHKLSISKSFIFALLLTLSACGRAEVSEERKAYILANEHGWVELAVDIPPSRFVQDGDPANCLLEVSVNGERFLSEPLFPRDGEKRSIRTGFLFAAPATQSEVELRYSGCQKEDARVSGVVPLSTDKLVKLEFDGDTLATSAPTPFKAAELGDLQQKLANIEAWQQKSDANLREELSVLFKLLVASLAILGVMLLAGVLKHMGIARVLPFSSKGKS